MRSPLRSSLRRRVTATGVLVVAVLTIAMAVFVYVSLRDRMMAELERVLAARTQLVQGLRPELTPQQVAARLDQVGMRSIVRTPDGEEYLIGGAPPFDEVPAGGNGESFAFRTVPLEDGNDVVVLASRGGIDSTLRRLLVLEAVGVAGVVAMAAVVLWRSSGRVLRPVRDVARTAKDIAAGDLSRRLATEDGDEELDGMVAAFNGMLDALENALGRARRSELQSQRFLADAAHQLRTPAAGIRASVATMMRIDDPDEREQLLDNLAGESARMSRLLSSLLRVARLDAGEPATRAPADLAALAEGVAARYRPLWPNLEFDVVRDRDVRVELDARAVEEALANLVDNAARHAERTIRLSVRRDDGTASVTVSDDGPGVPAAERERIFERFVSLDGRGGSGLGLPIARAVARTHDGDLTCTDEGFELRLPARP